MENCLVLLTKTYPYGKGEEFIEDEVPRLAEHFERIILLATSVEDGAVQTRQVPENVTVHPIPARTIQKSLVGNGLSLFPFTSCGGLVDDAEHNELRGNLKRRAFLLYFIAKSKAVYKECSRLLRKYDLTAYDGVTFYSFWFYDVALAALWLSGDCENPVKKAVSRAHRYDLYPSAGSLGYLPLRRYLLERLDAVYPCSENGTSYLAERYPPYARKVHTAYLGTRDYGPGPENTGDTIEIVSCCHIAPVKRVELLAQSLALLSGEKRKLHWVHFGDGAQLESLKSYAAEHLKFMKTDFPGSVKNEDLMKYYQKHPVDWFINTSSSEGLPVSIMEACSFGIPVIATDVGGTSEIVREGETGFLLDADFKPEDLAVLLRRLFRQKKGESAALRAGCRRVWEESFCASSNFDRFAREISPQDEDLSIASN